MNPKIGVYRAVDNPTKKEIHNGRTLIERKNKSNVKSEFKITIAFMLDILKWLKMARYIMYRGVPCVFNAPILCFIIHSALPSPFPLKKSSIIKKSS